MSINHLCNPDIIPKLDVYANSITSTIPIVSSDVPKFVVSNPVYTRFYPDQIIKSGNTKAEYFKKEVEVDGVLTTLMYYKEEGDISFSLLGDYVKPPWFSIVTNQLVDLDNPSTNLPNFCNETSDILYSKLEIKPFSPIETVDYTGAFFFTTNEAIVPVSTLIQIPTDNRPVQTITANYTSEARYFVELVWKYNP